jgi:hypothetical protein
MTKCKWPGCKAETDAGQPPGWENCVTIPPNRSTGPIFPDHVAEHQRMRDAGEIAPLSEDKKARWHAGHSESWRNAKPCGKLH